MGLALTGGVGVGQGWPDCNGMEKKSLNYLSVAIIDLRFPGSLRHSWWSKVMLQFVQSDGESLEIEATIIIQVIKLS